MNTAGKEVEGAVIKRATAASVSPILRGGGAKTETEGKARGRRGELSSSNAEEKAQTGARETIWWMREREGEKIQQNRV